MTSDDITRDTHDRPSDMFICTSHPAALRYMPELL